MPPNPTRPPALLGIDLGTSSVKAVVVDPEGGMLARSTSGTPGRPLHVGGQACPRPARGSDHRLDRGVPVAPGNPEVLHDLGVNVTPKTMFGLVTEALARRRQRSLSPFTIMSCDNIRGNGAVARRMFVAFARLKDPALGAWIDREVHFPSSMVDRITPRHHR